MTRRTLAAWVLAALCMLAVAGPRPVAGGAACGSYTSQSIPPPTVRIYRAASGTVETVDFRAYLKNVLSREWISSWTTESLRAGALAVKHYAWYQVLHWRGYVSASGQCFDLFDTARDQVYDPLRPVYAPMASAVDATWSTRALRNGSVFPTYYNAGAWNEPCGANANGWQMLQWGSQACGLDGLSAAQIMLVYYSGVLVTDAPPASTPAPTRTPSPRPSATPTPPASPAPSGPPGPTTPPPPIPPPTPTPKVSALPPSPELPGGGQVGLAAPPPPPPPEPAPIVVTAPVNAAAVAPLPTAAQVDIREMQGREMVRFERAADQAAAKAIWRPRSASPSLIAFRLWIGTTLDRLLGDVRLAWTAPFAHGQEVPLSSALPGLRRV
jgi:stage II sporulation SpoD-like protein